MQMDGNFEGRNSLTKSASPVGGGNSNKFWKFHPENWRKMNPLTSIFFQMDGSTTNRRDVCFSNS